MMYTQVELDRLILLVRLKADEDDDPNDDEPPFFFHFTLCCSLFFCILHYTTFVQNLRL